MTADSKQIICQTQLSAYRLMMTLFPVICKYSIEILREEIISQYSFHFLVGQRWIMNRRKKKISFSQKNTGNNRSINISAEKPPLQMAHNTGEKVAEIK